MSLSNQNIALCPVRHSVKSEGGCPLSAEASAKVGALFKAQDKNSSQEVYFDTPQEAYEWMLAHQGWVLKKREIVNWTFPLEQTIEQECWVKI